MSLVYLSFWLVLCDINIGFRQKLYLIDVMSLSRVKNRSGIDFYGEFW